MLYNSVFKTNVDLTNITYVEATDFMIKNLRLIFSYWLQSDFHENNGKRITIKRFIILIFQKAQGEVELFLAKITPSKKKPC